MLDRLPAGRLIIVSSLWLALVDSALAQQQHQQQPLSSSPPSWPPIDDSWNYWWSYSGVSGPSYWGLLNLDWFLCDKGRRQSPVNIETRLLYFDPHLTPLQSDNDLIAGTLYNDGHAIVFNASMPPASSLASSQIQAQSVPVNASAPMSQRTDRRGRSTARLPVGQEEQLFGELIGSSSAELGASTNNLQQLLERGRAESDVHTGQDSILQGALGEQTEASADVQAGANDEPPVQASRFHFSGAGLAYSYAFEALYLRFGGSEAHSTTARRPSGSEHRIDSHAYAAELQLLAYNTQLYRSYGEALSRPHGLLAIAILVDVLTDTDDRPKVDSPGSSRALEVLLERVADLKHRSSFVALREFNLSALLPQTEFFVTYQGSLTVPGCHESVDWLVLNKPLYIAQASLDVLRSISADEQTPSAASTGTRIAGNTRPVQPLNGRPLRTNIRPIENSENCQKSWTRYEYRQGKQTSGLSSNALS